MFRFLIGLAILGTVVGVVVAGLAIGGVIDSEGCPYGYSSSRSGSASSSCKSRPVPEQVQMNAALDGSALEKGLAAFRKSVDAGADVLGVGVNAWGETTFTIPDGKNAFGAPKQRHVTFERAGTPAPSDNAFRRQYVTTTTNTEALDIGAIEVAPYRKALARVRRGEPAARLKSATYERGFAFNGFGWTLSFILGAGESIRGFSVHMDADGRGLCVFGTEKVRGVKACELTQPGVGGATPPTSGSAPPPSAPAVPQNKQLDCVQKAAGDATKMLECVKG